MDNLVKRIDLIEKEFKALNHEFAAHCNESDDIHVSGAILEAIHAISSLAENIAAVSDLLGQLSSNSDEHPTEASDPQQD